LASRVDAQLVLQETRNGRYVLGPEAIAIGLAAMRQSDELANMAEEYQLSCFLAVLGNH
jgi:DNA-binding IclR family transcriptional regulator